MIENILSAVLSSPRRLLFWLAGVILGIVVLHYLFVLLSSGTLAVTTNDNSAQITITNFSGNPTVTKTHKGHGYNAHLAPGAYLVTVSDGSKRSQHYATVAWLKATKAEVDLSPNIDPEPVSDRGVTSLTASTTAMRFIDYTNNNLYGVDSNNNEHLIDSDHNFQHVDWANDSYGVAQTSDGSLYLINDDTVSSLGLPFPTPSDPKSISYGVDGNRNLYLSDGHSIYFGQPGSALKQIYSSQNQFVSIIKAGNVAVFFLTHTPGSSKDGSFFLNTLTPSGKTASVPGSVYDASWSPDGTSLVTSEDSESTIRNLSLQVTQRLPVNNVNTPTWIDNASVAYGVEGNLWRYDTSSQTSQLISQMPDGQSLSAIYTNTDHSYVYAVSADGDNNTTLLRVSTTNQPSSPLVRALGQILPNTYNNCYIGYMNFTRPTVIVHGQATAEASCTDAAVQYLTPYAGIVDMSKLPMSFSAGS